MADQGFVHDVSKMLIGSDAAKSPSTTSQPEAPNSSKRQLGAETDKRNGPAFKLELVRLLDEQSKSQDTATQQLLSKNEENYK